MAQPDTDIEKFITLLRRQWDLIEIGGYDVIDAVADVVDEHYGKKIVKGESCASES